MVFLRDFYCIQLQFLFLSSIGAQAMIVFSQPFVNKGQQSIAVINEVMNSIYLYINMMLTDFHGYDTMRDQFG